MTPLLPIILGLAAIALGSLLLRSYGPRARVGRLLVVTVIGRHPTVRLRHGLGSRRAGDRARTIVRASALRAGLACLLLVVSLAPGAAPAVLAASPSPAIGDVRTTTAPGLVGDPLFAIAGVLLVGAVAVAATLAYVRLTAPRSRR